MNDQDLHYITLYVRRRQTVSSRGGRLNRCQSNSLNSLSCFLLCLCVPAIFLARLFKYTTCLVMVVFSALHIYHYICINTTVETRYLELGYLELAIWNSVISNQVIWNSVISNQVISNQVISNSVIWNQVISNSVIWNQVISNQVIWNSVISNQVISNSPLSRTIFCFPWPKLTPVISNSNDEVDEQTSKCVRTQLESVLKRH